MKKGNYFLIGIFFLVYCLSEGAIAGVSETRVAYLEDCNRTSSHIERHQELCECVTNFILEKREPGYLEKLLKISKGGKIQERPFDDIVEFEIGAIVMCAKDNQIKLVPKPEGRGKG